MKHVCKKELSQNFYKAMDGLSPQNPIMVTNHGKPDLVIMKATPNSIGALSASQNMLPNSYSFSAQAMSTFSSQGFTPEQSQAIVDTFKELLGSNSSTPSPSLEVKNEKDKIK